MLKKQLLMERSWYKHLPALMPADISKVDAEEEIEYSNEDAIDLLKNSTIFDQFITDAMNDFEQFSKKKAETNEKLIEYLRNSFFSGGMN